MTEDNLKEYLESHFGRVGRVPDEVRNIVRRLIDLTLQYRDRLKAETGEILTVEETKIAIDIFLSGLKTGRIPSRLEGKTAELIKLWMNILKG